MRLQTLRKNKSVFLFFLCFLCLIMIFSLISNNISSNQTNFEDNPIHVRQPFVVNVYLNASYYQSSWWVYISVRYTDGGSPVVGALVSYQIDDPTPTTKFFDTKTTNSTGWCNTTYHLPSSATEGTWWVYVSADDNNGHIAYTNTTFLMDDTAPTTSTITSPSAGAYLRGTAVTVSANAADNIGGSGVAYVEFWDGVPGSGSLIGTDSSSPYSTTWDTTSTSDGAHTLYSRVYDNAGNYLDSAGISVTVDNTNPITAQITSPSAGAIISGNLFIQANAVDNGGGSGVDYVEFWDGLPGSGTLIGSDSFSPYDRTWDTTTTSDGSHDLYVRVYDRAGNYLDSSAVTITIDNTDPITSTITSPSAGAYVSGTAVSITANAADNGGGSGVDYVEFWDGLPGSGTLIGSDTTAPYSQSWDTTLVSDGSHDLYSRVYDRAGNYLDSSAVTVTVDNTAPTTATITAPSAGAYLRGNVLISATAADGGSGVDYVEFWDGLPGSGTLIGTDTTAPYSQNWNTATAGEGAHDLYVRVYDRAGNYLDSAATSVTVDNTNPITSSITSPSAGAIVRGTISVDASAADNGGGSGVDYVEFWDGLPGSGSLIGTDTSAPYSVSWNTATASDGAHDLYSRVYDRAGNYLDSAAVSITVDNTPPSTATITSPATGANLSGSVSITANAVDGESGVDYVEFWLDGTGTGTLLGTDTTSPYSVTWDTTTATDGSHTLTCRVYDRAGNSLDSSSVNVIVDNTAPISVSITSPSGGAYLSGSISISATAADNTGGTGVAYVEFWDGLPGSGTLLGTDTSSPYSQSWDTTSTTEGAHTLYVRIYDYANNYLDSSGVAVTVDNTVPTTDLPRQVPIYEEPFPFLLLLLIMVAVVGSIMWSSGMDSLVVERSSGLIPLLHIHEAGTPDQLVMVLMIYISACMIGLGTI